MSARYGDAKDIEGGGVEYVVEKRKRVKGRDAKYRQGHDFSFRSALKRPRPGPQKFANTYSPCHPGS